jgi:subtilisin family serine protease/subtilisin-like proprotein convertase family protein
MDKIRGAGARDGLHSADRGAMRAAQGVVDAAAAGQVAAALSVSSDAAVESGAAASLAAGDDRFANRLDFVPSDTLYPSQTQYTMVGDIQTVWDEYTGDGVSVGVYDSGVQYTHPDLAPNYDASKHVTYNSVVYDGGPAATSPIGHGTHVAGIIAGDAAGQNGVGFAHGASLTGINIFDPASALDVNATSSAGFFAAYNQLTTFDVINNSWGSDGRFASTNNRNVAGSFGQGMHQSYVLGAADGRGDLGTIITNSAGNRNMDVQGEGRKSGMETIVVAAARIDGFAAYYSNFGSNVLVTAPGGGGSLANDPLGGGDMLSTDLTGVDGYSPGDFSAISGTSMATPVISGVVALMLEANPDLGWRDVQQIIAYSATETGSGVGAALGANEDNLWYYNGADNWNGGGLHFSEDYGYGMIDPYAAVRMAEVWTQVRQAQTSDNDVTITTPQQAVGTNFGATFDQSFTFTVTDHLDLEHVTLDLNLDRNQFWQMDIWLTSPEGTEVQLANTVRVAGNEGNYDADDWFSYSAGLLDRTWSYGAQAFRGEDSAGTWTVRIVDAENRVWSTPNPDANINYTIDWLQMTFVGAADDTDDHYVYTDEFADVVDGPRGALSDTDGGFDAINAAAVTGDSLIDLSGAETSIIAGEDLTISGVIESAFGGDGDDTLIDNASANHLSGGRGADRLESSGGADRLEGGAGSDVLVFDRSAGSLAIGIDLLIAGNQVVADGSIINGIEALWAIGGSGADTFGGGALSDTLDGGSDDDQLFGRGGSDTLLGGNGKDLLNGGPGDDSIDGGGGVDRLSYASATAAVSIDLSDTGAQATGGGGSDTLAGIEKLIGSAFGDTLTGDAMRNVLRGEDGADTLDGGVFNDILVGGAGIDAFLITAVGTVQGARGSILDLEAGETVDLSALDANSNEAGNDAFEVVTRFTGAGGELMIRYNADDDRTRLIADIDGDKQADFTLFLNGDQRAFDGLEL